MPPGCSKAVLRTFQPASLRVSGQGARLVNWGRRRTCGPRAGADEVPYQHGRSGMNRDILSLWALRRSLESAGPSAAARPEAGLACSAPRFVRSQAHAWGSARRKCPWPANSASSKRNSPPRFAGDFNFRVKRCLSSTTGWHVIFRRGHGWATARRKLLCRVLALVESQHRTPLSELHPWLARFGCRAYGAMAIIAALLCEPATVTARG
jgi:hypothetical protein